MKQAILVAGGPSVNDGIALGLWGKIAAQEIWSLNYAYKAMPYLPSRQLWVDHDFFSKNIEDMERLWKCGVQMVARKNNRYALLNHYLGEAIRQHETTRERNGFKGIHTLTDSNNHVYIGHMGLVGFFALTLAIAERYQRIYLLGYDWGSSGRSDSFTHFYQNTIEVSSTGVGHPEIYFEEDGSVKKNVRDFEVYLRERDEFGYQIINVSPNSHIPYFPKIDYPTFFEQVGAPHE